MASAPERAGAATSASGTGAAASVSSLAPRARGPRSSDERVLGSGRPDRACGPRRVARGLGSRTHNRQSRRRLFGGAGGGLGLHWRGGRAAFWPPATRALGGWVVGARQAGGLFGGVASDPAHGCGAPSEALLWRRLSVAFERFVPGPCLVAFGLQAEACPPPARRICCRPASGVSVAPLRRSMSRVSWSRRRQRPVTASRARAMSARRGFAFQHEALQDRARVRLFLAQGWRRPSAASARGRRPSRPAVSAPLRPGAARPRKNGASRGSSPPARRTSER